MEDWSDFHKKCVASSTDKPSSGSLRRIKHSYCPSAMSLGKNGIKILLSKAKLLPLLSTVVLSSFAMLSFMVLYFSIKKTSVPSRRTRHKSHQTRHKAQGVAAGAQGQCDRKPDMGHKCSVPHPSQCWNFTWPFVFWTNFSSYADSGYGTLSKTK